jgi:hypothetical protein
MHPGDQHFLGQRVVVKNTAESSYWVQVLIENDGYKMRKFKVVEGGKFYEENCP